MAYQITVTSATVTNSQGYDRAAAQGSIDPVYANIDQVTTMLGAMGRIQQFRAVQDEVTTIWSTTLTLAGLYATAADVPFTTLTTPGLFGSTYNKVDAVFSTSGGNTHFVWNDKTVLSGTFILTVLPAVPLSEFWTHLVKTQEII